MAAAAAAASACVEGDSGWYGSTAFLLFSRHTCNPLPETAAVWPSAATAAAAVPARGTAAAVAEESTATCSRAGGRLPATAQTGTAAAAAGGGGATDYYSDAAAAAAAGRASIAASSAGAAAGTAGEIAGRTPRDELGQSEVGTRPAFAAASRLRGSAAAVFIDRQPWEELPHASAEIQAAAAAAAKLWNRSRNSSTYSDNSKAEGNLEAATENLRNEADAETARVVFDKFYSDSQEERLVAVCSVGNLATALSCNQRELLLFLLTHLEQENDRLVLEAVGRELLALLQREERAAAPAAQQQQGGQKEEQQQQQQETTGRESELETGSRHHSSGGKNGSCSETGSSSRSSGGDSRRSTSEEKNRVAGGGSVGGEDSSSGRDSSGGEEESDAVLFFKLLLHLLLQQDRETREVAQAALYRLFSSRRYVSLAVLQQQLVPRVLLLLQDDGLRSQAAAAVLLPIAAFHLQQRLCEAKQYRPQEPQPQEKPPQQQQEQQQQEEEGQEEEEEQLRATGGEKQLELLVHAYAALCKDTALIYVQQQAGTRLPLFVEMCGAALRHSLAASSPSAAATEGHSFSARGEQTPGGSSSSRKREEGLTSAVCLNKSSSNANAAATTAAAARERSGRPAGEKERQQLLQILAQLLSSYVSSPSETLRMQGVQGLAAMADHDPKLFRELGKEFLPRLCTDVSWRVRAAVCERLERLAAVFTGGGPGTAAAAGGGGRSVAAAASQRPTDSSSSVPGLVLGEGTCLASLLTQLLKDREMNVKSAALRKIRQLTQAAGSCAGVCSAFLEEGDALCSSIGAAAAAGAPAPIFTEFMETLCCLMRLPSSSNETRWQLTIFAFTLLNVNDWHVAVCFLKELEAFLSCPPPCFYAVLMARLETLVHSPGSCWRTRATILQQIPLILLQQEIEEGVVMRLWVLLLRLLQDDVWAVRQEGGAALERIVASCKELPQQSLSRAEAASSSNSRKEGGAAAAAAGEAAAAKGVGTAAGVMRQREVLLQQQLLPLFRDLQRSKRCSVRGEICRYAVLLHSYFSKEAWEQHLRPFVETALADPTPQTRYAAAKAIQLLVAAQQQKEAAAATASQQVVSATWLSKMKEKVLADQDADVAAVFDIPDSH